MGRGGPPPTPTALRLLRGNPGKRPINTEEPALERANTAPPKGLKGKARAEWVRLVDELVDKGLLSVAELEAFRAYCELVAEVDEYQRLIRRVGREDAHRLGYVGHLLKARTQLRQFMLALGLTPTTRSGVRAIKTAQTSDAQRTRDRFFGNRGTSASA